MGGRVVHFELPFDDADRAKSFYRELFGWQLQDVPGVDYSLVSTGPTGEQGATEPGFINGGMGRRSGPDDHPRIVIDVESIEQTLEAVSQRGGSVAVGKQPVGDMGFTAYFTDPEGNLVGLWETAPRQG